MTHPDPRGDARADALLARALRGPIGWPRDAAPDRVVERALYHGVAGCLAGRLGGWLPEVAEPLRHAALAQAMWELRHRLILGDLLAALDAAGVRVLVLKGSALAYDLYDPPSARTRGDSDILIAPADLPAARSVLAAKGLARHRDAFEEAGTTRHEETWSAVTPDGLRHDIDLHWQAIDAAALAGALPFEEAWARARPLPRLGPSARGLPLDLALVLACAHRAMHIVSPYHMGEQTYHGGDRLIWLRDIDLLARALGPDDWDRVQASCKANGLAAVCLDGLDLAARRLGTPLPAPVLARLAAAPPSAASRYLLSERRLGRMWSDLLASRGARGRWAYLRAGLFPPADHMRSKYPGWAGLPLPLLYLRRIAAFGRAQSPRRPG